MKKIIETHSNGWIKHEIEYYSDHTIHYEYYADENGGAHRKGGKPAIREWYENGMIMHISYYNHKKHHNIYNPAYIRFISNGKIWRKTYSLSNFNIDKLKWLNNIKQI